MKKSLIIGISIFISLSMSSCNKADPIVDSTSNVEEEVGSSINNDQENLSTLITFSESIEETTLSLFNLIGDIKISPSDSDKVEMTTKVHLPNLADEDKQEILSSLFISLLQSDGVFYAEPVYKNDDNINFLEWIDEKIGSENISFDYDIKIPDTITEVRICNAVGDIKIIDVTSKIYAQTSIGDIELGNITPIDEVRISTDTGDLYLNLSSIENLNRISAVTDIGDVTIDTLSDIDRYISTNTKETPLLDLELLNENSEEAYTIFRDELRKPSDIKEKSGELTINTSARHGDIEINKID